MVVLLAAMAAYVWATREDLADFRRLSLPILGATILIQFLSQLLFNEAMRLPLRTHMQGLGFWEFYLVRSGGAVVGSLVPVAGGIAVRLAYLKRRGLTYLDFTWATLLSNVLALAAAAALAVLATGVLWAMGGRPPMLVVALLAAILALSVAVLVVFRLLPRLGDHPWLRRWPSLSGVSGYKESGGTMGKVFALSFARHCLNFMTFGLLYQFLTRAPRDFLTGGLVYALTSPLRMINITPANVGVIEWVVAIVGQLLAFDLATGLIVALLFRGIALVAQGLGVLLAWAWVASRSESA
jgi:hypothetical protein